MNNHSGSEESFKPKGAIAFMVLLFVLAALIWFTIYNLQVERHL